MPSHNDIVQRYTEVVARIREAAEDAGRDPDQVRLIAVSKLHPAEAVETLYRSGHLDFGESYIQEALAKMEELPRAIRWHFIGHVQTNKAKFIPGNFALVHSVDSIKLARALHSKAQKVNSRQAVLVQINLAREEQKSGVAPENLPSLMDEILKLDHILVQGLMVMPPLEAQGEQARPYFATLRSLRSKLEQDYHLQLPHLSMGMSGDFIQAVEEGATFLRIGTEIFGPRSYR